MNLQTFTAPTMAEALAQVKRVLGHDAMILHTRTMQRREWLGLRRREVVEVTAGPSSGDHRRRKQGEAKQSVAAGRGDSQRSDGRVGGVAEVGAARKVGAGGAIGAAAYARNSNQVSLAESKGAGSAGAAVRSALGQQVGGGLGGVAGGAAGGGIGGGVGGGMGVPSPKSLVSSPEMTGVMVKLVTEEMSELKSELRELVKHVRSGGGSGGAARGPGGIPDELFGHYQQLIENQVASELAEDIIKAVRLAVPAGYLGNEKFVREKISEQLEKLLPAGGPIRRTKATGAHVVALIGPTGVGKTTTLAKLAAELQLREGKKVGMITMDTYRIAAVDQLRRYSDIIGSPLVVVNSPGEMKAAIASMAEMDYVLIDTAGRSPTDTMKLSELRQFLEAAAPDEVHLVLSTTSDSKCVDIAVAAFSKVRVDRILFTKVDEAATVGVVLNVARKVGKAISYLTTGQDVPYDIEVFRGGRLAQLIMERSEVSGVFGAEERMEKSKVVAKSVVLSRTISEPRLATTGGLQ